MKISTRILFSFVLAIFALYGFAIQDGLTQKKRPIRVVMFWSIECPVAQKYTQRINTLVEKYGKQGVQFEAYFSQEGETRDQVQKVLNQRNHKFQWITDPGAEIAQSFGVDRVPTVIVITPENEIVYSGMIDDAPERERPATKHYLADALDAAIQKKAPAVSQTKVIGCAIMAEMSATQTMKTASYNSVHRDLVKHCLPCHTTGGAAPIPFDNFVDVRRWAPMIHETISKGTMPPYGMASSDRNTMKEAVQKWRDDGRPGLTKNFPPEKKVLPQAILKISTPIVIPTNEIHVTRTVRQRITQSMKFSMFAVKSRIPTMLRSADIFFTNASGETIWAGAWIPGSGPKPISPLPKNTVISVRLRYVSSFKPETDQPILEFYPSSVSKPELRYLVIPASSAEQPRNLSMNFEFRIPKSLVIGRMRLFSPFGAGWQEYSIKRGDGRQETFLDRYSMGVSWEGVTDRAFEFLGNDQILVKVNYDRPQPELFKSNPTQNISLELGISSK